MQVSSRQIVSTHHAIAILHRKMEKKYQKRARQSLNKEQKNYTTSMSANSKYNQSKTQQLNTQKKGK
jgi:hypothetical protein